MSWSLTGFCSFVCGCLSRSWWWIINHEPVQALKVSELGGKGKRWWEKGRGSDSRPVPAIAPFQRIAVTTQRKRERAANPPSAPCPRANDGRGAGMCVGRILFPGTCRRAETEPSILLCRSWQGSPPCACWQEDALIEDNGLIVRWILMKLPGTAAQSASA